MNRKINVNLSLLAAALVLYLPTFKAQPAPAFVWGSDRSVEQITRKDGLQTFYEVISAPTLISKLIEPPCATSQTADCLDTTSDAQAKISLLMVGKLQRQEIARQQSSLAKAIKQMIDEASSAVYFPNTVGLDDGLLQKLKTSDNILQIPNLVDPAQVNGSMEAFEVHLAQTAKPTVALMVLDESFLALSDVLQKLQMSGRPHVVLYISQEQQVQYGRTARHLLSKTSQEPPLCGTKCMVQVRLFETIILLATVLTALYTGLWMLHILDGPTRFESEKKETRQHQE